MSSAEPPLATNLPDEIERRIPRYVVGIDAGTTNCALCFVDADDVERRIQTFLIPQIVAAGAVESLETLPSFHYDPLPQERSGRSLKLPWQNDSALYVVGAYARDHGRTIPGRMIESAKSWLCHNGVDRRAALLPWHAAEDIARLSPVEASARYLRHLLEAWNAIHLEHPLQNQDVVLTIPASFDEVARELTVAAARAAGLTRIMLIEEPQAAFYSWVYAHRDSWEQQVAAGQKILVCDIGGGTSDFSLIEVRSGSDGRIQFHRVAVGDHLLLGGDNLDLALAHYVEQQLVARQMISGDRLDARQWSMLLPACRHAKEILLSADAPETHTIVISGTGSRLIGGSLQLEVSRNELLKLFIEGFLPVVDFGQQPSGRQSGFQEFGLPYAADPAITKYLAAFLRAHAQVSQDAETGVPAVHSDNDIRNARPDVILFNGGFFASAVLRERLIECVRTWFQAIDPSWSPLVLRNERLDLAVAQGAAYFGMVRRGEGVRIVAGLARSYYVGVDRADGSRAALCLIAAGSEPSSETQPIEHEFQVRTSEPVEFPILVSGTRLTDRPGQIVDYDPEQMTALPPIRTVLTTRKKGEVLTARARISVRLTEIGTLEMWCEQLDGPRRWQLQFDIRSATETDRAAHSGSAEGTGIVDQESLGLAAHIIREVFASGGTAPVDGVARRISAEIGISRTEWPPSLLRGLWAELMEHEASRRRSAALEARWLNLTGFCLRPGFGMAADDWRVEETWKTLKGRLIHGGPSCLTEWRILCRRIAGGLTVGRQTQLAATVIPLIRQKHRQVITGRGRAGDYASSSHEAAEIWRMLGSLELLDQTSRAELGNIIGDFLEHRFSEPIQPALIWTLGRLGARIPLYGPLNLVLPVSTIRPWIRALLDRCQSDNPESRSSEQQDVTRLAAVQLALMQLSRRTGDRFRDIDDGLRNQIVVELTRNAARPHLIELVRDGGRLEGEEATQVFGESLPSGLTIL